MLGLFAKKFLQKRGINKVPPELAFMWGPARSSTLKNKRNPSSGSWRFQNMYSYGDAERAGVTRMATAILADLRKRLVKREPHVSMRDIEMSLFMIGYDVSEIS